MLLDQVVLRHALVDSVIPNYVVHTLLHLLGGKQRVTCVVVLVVDVLSLVRRKNSLDKILVSHLEDTEEELMLRAHVFFDVIAWLFEKEVLVFSYYVFGSSQHVKSIINSLHVKVKQTMRVLVLLNAVNL